MVTSIMSSRNIKITKSSDKVVTDKILSRLTSNGVVVNEFLVQLVISEYLRVKKDTLTKTKRFKEEGIGTMELTTRKLTEAFSDRGFTSRIKVTMDDDYKASINEELSKQQGGN